MRKRDLLKILLQGVVIEFYNTGFERMGNKAWELGYYQLRYPSGATASLGMKQGHNITSQWCYFDNKDKCYRLNEPARLLLTGKTS
jgi:hypothetical protein